MLIQPYQLDKLTFAWCYRVYYRWRTHRAAAAFGHYADALARCVASIAPQ